MARKKPEPKPPAKYLRARLGGLSAEVIRTTKKTEYGRWLYKLWYGDVMGNGRYTLDELLMWNVRWCKNKPSNLISRAAANKSKNSQAPNDDSR